MATIRVEGVSKRFGATQALDDVSFEIPEGEFVVVLGASGSGKSTLLRCMNGLTKPTSGTITVDGVEITEPHPDIAMIFQQHNIIDQMSAYANALTGSLQRTNLVNSVLQLNDREDKLRALEALETVGLLDEAQQRTRRMSGGQQQRVGIARALVQEPNVLLADEPVASLDPGSSNKVMGYLLSATEDRNLTTMVSLHQVNLARQFGQRFIGLKNGELVFDGYSEDFDLDVVDDIYETVDTDDLDTGEERTSQDDGVTAQ
ncbi:phosphonate ABC transporter ATP-binding protein [Natrononativus amylolyticus]|uniref:phosphonate ABC transporter ATP-binding protein n=1 Tax=Natrononativus amylolyticus TaxID=2963434 RepID=UPI0020CE990D|nr:phosphonate ABC transporter ATP-binding protein [Natrononativus amylolyticus]